MRAPIGRSVGRSVIDFRFSAYTVYCSYPRGSWRAPGAAGGAAAANRRRNARGGCCCSRPLLVGLLGHCLTCHSSHACEASTLNMQLCHCCHIPALSLFLVTFFVASYCHAAATNNPTTSKLGYGSCNSGKDTVDFDIEDKKGTGTIKAADGRCLSVKDCATQADWGSVVLQECAPSTCEGKHQQWTAKPVPDKPGATFPVNGLGPKWCLNIPPTKGQAAQQDDLIGTVLHRYWAITVLRCAAALRRCCAAA